MMLSKRIERSLLVSSAILKPVFFTDAKFDSAQEAKKALEMSKAPEFRVEFDLRQVPGGYGGLTSGNEVEFRLRESAAPIPVIRTQRLKE